MLGIPSCGSVDARGRNWSWGRWGPKQGLGFRVLGFGLRVLRGFPKIRGTLQGGIYGEFYRGCIGDNY